MTSLRHWALGCCVLCALAGMIRTFWPDHAFKPVINLVLTLYILTSVLHGAAGADWQGFAAELRSWTDQSLEAEDYSSYGVELERQQSAKAIQDLLRQSGIESVVQQEENGYRIHLAYPADREQAEELLERYGEGLSWTVETAQ
ncbi:MAG: hypothetical protein PUE19_07000 [bacterium]|nr:hypothetical protein [bacterium]